MKKALFLYLFLVSFVSYSQTYIAHPKANDSLQLYSDKIFPSWNFFLLQHDWKFKVGDDLSWKNTDLDDSDWVSIERDSLGKIIKKEINFQGKGWFRNTFEIDSTLVSIPLSLSINLTGAYTVYLDGESLKTLGKFKTQDSETEDHIPLKPFKTEYIDFIFKEKGIHTIAIRYETSNIKKTDDFLNFKIELGKKETTLKIADELNRGISFAIFIGAIFLTLSIFHLILFLFYREFIPNLYFSLFSFSMAAVFFVILFLFKGFNIEAAKNAGILMTFLTYLSAFSLSGLVNTLFVKKKLRFRIFTIISIIGVILLFVAGEVSVFLVTFLYLYALIEATILLLRAIFKKVKGARILASGFLLTIFFTLMFFLFVFIAYKEGEMNIEGDSPIAKFFAVIVIGFILSIFSIPFSMSAYLAWYFSYINKENELKVEEVEDLTQKNILQEKEKQSLIENINYELEIQVENRKTEIEIQKSEIELQNQDLEFERQKSEKLLLNILPEEIARELKDSGKSDSKKFDNVSVLFTDFKDFTKLAETISSTELIEELNYCFKEFDQIIFKYGIEKIKTIGDAYMAVSGLPVEDENHAVKMVEAALEIRDFMESYIQRRKAEGKSYFEMRIGINSGKVVAGIVGIKKFAYDIWGDTVTIASRMETNGVIGKINISQNTYELVKDHFDLEYRHDESDEENVKMYFAEHKQKASMNFKKMKEFILDKLENELPEHLKYHNIEHILDVYQASINYAELEGINEEDTILLKTASLFHDSGFIVQAEGHEQISCDIAQKHLPDFGYTQEQIDKIKGMIMATKIPQSPGNHLEQILADSDLDYFGRDDFEQISEGLFEELGIKDRNEWNKIQISFFEKHRYFTESAKRLRNEKKQLNLDKIISQTEL